MPRKITTYTLDHPGNEALSAELAELGSFTDEGEAREAMSEHVGEPLVWTDIYQVDSETAAFSAYPSVLALEADVTRVQAPRVLQRNVEV